MNSKCYYLKWWRQGTYLLIEGVSNSCANFCTKGLTLCWSNTLTSKRRLWFVSLSIETNSIIVCRKCRIVGRLNRRNSPQITFLLLELVFNFRCSIRCSLPIFVLTLLTCPCSSPRNSLLRSEHRQRNVELWNTRGAVLACCSAGDWCVCYAISAGNSHRFPWASDTLKEC